MLANFQTHPICTQNFIQIAQPFRMSFGDKHRDTGILNIRIYISLKHTSKRSNDTPWIAVALLTCWIVVELFPTFIALDPVEVRLAVTLTIIVARRTDGTRFVTITSYKNCT